MFLLIEKNLILTKTWIVQPYRVNVYIKTYFSVFQKHDFYRMKYSKSI